MKIDLTQCIQQLSLAADTYEKFSGSIPSPENLNGLGISLEDVRQTIDKLSASARSLDGKTANGITSFTAIKNIIAHSTAMNQFFNAQQNNQQQILAHTEQICNWMAPIENGLSELARNVDDYADDTVIAGVFATRLTQTDGWLQQASELNKNMSEHNRKAEEILGNIKDIEAKLQELMKATEEMSSKVEANDRSTSTAKTNAEAAASEATSSAEKIKNLVEDIESSVTVKDQLFEEFNSRRAEISNLLENANKVGLAKSFQDKRKNLTMTWIVWSILFVVGIAGLMLVGFLEILPLVKAPKLEITELSVRLALVGPLIWLTWFAARQYGHIVRLSEDYAFKEAAAMAFAGYRNEVSNDEELLKMLQENAIRNFGANPSRLLFKKPEPASPVHDALEMVADKTKLRDLLSKLLDAVK